MKIVIIEDEQIAADDICSCIKEARQEYDIVKVLGSVSESIEYFLSESDIDLIFSDIQLSDGLCFEIFEHVEVKPPIIFCTAYNHYALEAFKNNGIDYILKPFDCQSIAKALKKYENLTGNYKKNLDALIHDFTAGIIDKTVKVKVYHKDKIIPISLDDIAIFYLKGKLLMLRTFSGEVFHINRKLDELEDSSGNDFFRANRQILINRKAIRDVSQHQKRKMKINLNIENTVEIIVSKEKSKELIAWLLEN